MSILPRMTLFCTHKIVTGRIRIYICICFFVYRCIFFTKKKLIFDQVTIKYWKQKQYVASYYCYSSWHKISNMSRNVKLWSLINGGFLALKVMIFMLTQLCMYLPYVCSFVLLSARSCQLECAYQFGFFVVASHFSILAFNAFLVISTWLVCQSASVCQSGNLPVCHHF